MSTGVKKTPKVLGGILDPVTAVLAVPGVRQSLKQFDDVLHDASGIEW